jgi:hypothetical protein
MTKSVTFLHPSLSDLTSIRDNFKKSFSESVSGLDAIFNGCRLEMKNFSFQCNIYIDPIKWLSLFYNASAFMHFNVAFQASRSVLGAQFATSFAGEASWFSYLISLINLTFLRTGSGPQEYINTLTRASIAAGVSGATFDSLSLFISNFWSSDILEDAIEFLPNQILRFALKAHPVSYDTAQFKDPNSKLWRSLPTNLVDAIHKDFDLRSLPKGSISSFELSNYLTGSSLGNHTMKWRYFICHKDAKMTLHNVSVITLTEQVDISASLIGTLNLVTYNGVSSFPLFLSNTASVSKTAIEFMTVFLDCKVEINESGKYISLLNLYTQITPAQAQCVFEGGISRPVASLIGGFKTDEVPLSQARKSRNQDRIDRGAKKKLRDQGAQNPASFKKLNENKQETSPLSLFCDIPVADLVTWFSKQVGGTKPICKVSENILSNYLGQIRQNYSPSKSPMLA